MVTIPAPSQGEIWIVNFEPAVGGEIRKLRPAIVAGRNSIGRLPLESLFRLPSGNVTTSDILGSFLSIPRLRMA
jgi:hypothetical protein